MTAMVTFNGITGQQLITKSGNVAGVRMTFGSKNTLKASEIKAQLREEGMKGRELTRKVNEVLKGEEDIRWAKAAAVQSAFRSSGYIPDYTDARKTGATIRFVKPNSPTAGISETDALEALALSSASY